MPPRGRKTASPARSPSAPSSRRNSLSKASPAVEEASARSTPAPDPAAVQRLIDEAMARAAARRTATPAGRAGLSATRSRGWCRGGCVVTRFFSWLFPARDRIYSAHTTALLTDLIGAFLVTCLAVYFTAAGYLLYRDVALSS